jgi:regulator of RNase E activity RraB
MQRIGRYLILLILLVATTGCSLFNFANSDQAALDSLLEAGSDFSKLHPFDFYVYHNEKSGAERICADLADEGFQVVVREGAVAGEWLCLASISFIPSIEKLSEFQIVFEELIDQYGGEYDGWETIVVTN